MLRKFENWQRPGLFIPGLFNQIKYYDGNKANKKEWIF